MGTSGGYCGKLLRVNLTTGQVADDVLSSEAARAFIGGSGLAAHLHLEAVAPALESGSVGSPDPLGPDNPLVVMTGPLTGTRLPFSARWTVSARSPLTGIWGESNCGGTFGAELKFAGYDGLYLLGRAAQPVYLLIENGTAALRPAADLWGQDTYATQDVLGQRHPGAKVMAIGPAGENLVRFACVNHDKHHAAGRTGMGAVMGSKNLKAVVVRGAEKRVTAADPDGLKTLAETMVRRAGESMVITTLREAGTLASLDLGALIGDIPLRNWSLGAWEGLSELTATSYGQHLTGQASCFACPAGCFRKVTVEGYGRSLKNAPGAEYETVGCLGANLLVSDLAAIHAAGEVCNRLGLDTISAGGTLAYAYEAADRGLLDGVEGGASLRGAWGDGARLVALLEDIAFRRGIGEALAEGSAALARRIGKPEAASFLTTVKGLEAPAHDPRAAHGMGIAYATSTRGACHMNSMMFNLEHMGFTAPEAGLDYDGMQQVSAGKGVLNKAAQDLGCVFGQAAVLCHLGGSIYTAADLLTALNVVTGFGLTMEEMLECGARIWHLKRGLGNLYGLQAADDRLPPRLSEVLAEGGAAGSVPDMDLMLSEWYEARGLEAGTGRAKRGVLEALGLTRLADLLERIPQAKAGR